MMKKRMAKMEAAASMIEDSRWYGPSKADITFITWGSTYGPLREAVDLLNNQGQPSNMLSISNMWPFPAKQVGEAVDNAHHVITVEANYSGQMADLICQVTGRTIECRIGKCDGRPFSPQYIIRALREELRFNV